MLKTNRARRRSLLRPLPLQAEIIEQVLVKVNGDIVTKTDFERAADLPRSSRPELRTSPRTASSCRRRSPRVTPELILDAVDELLLVQRGRELGYALGDEQFKSILDNIKKENNIDDDEKFQAALKQEGMTLADLRRNLERRCS